MERSKRAWLSVDDVLSYLDEEDQFTDHRFEEDGPMMEASDDEFEDLISEEMQERDVLGDGSGDEDDEWEDRGSLLNRSWGMRSTASGYRPQWSSGLTLACTCTWVLYSCHLYDITGALMLPYTSQP